MRVQQETIESYLGWNWKNAC